MDYLPCLYLLVRLTLNLPELDQTKLMLYQIIVMPKTYENIFPEVERTLEKSPVEKSSEDEYRIKETLQKLYNYFM